MGTLGSLGPHQVLLGQQWMGWYTQASSRAPPQGAGDLVGPGFNSNYYKYDLRNVNYQSQKSNLNANTSHKVPKEHCESFLDIYTTHFNTVLPVSVVVYRGQCRKKQAVRIQVISTKLVTEKRQACYLSIHTLF